MDHNLDHTMALLARTPAALDALLRDLPEFWTRGNEGGKTWSPFDVVAHLVHAERSDWIPRTKMVVEFGESKTFEPFDREGNQRESHGRTLAELLDEFSRLRSDNLAELRSLNLAPQDLARQGRHPMFGSVTLSALLATWAAHDLTHLHQLSRILAYQYREAVGPWGVYLGVMNCDAHSSAG